MIDNDPVLIRNRNSLNKRVRSLGFSKISNTAISTPGRLRTLRCRLLTTWGSRVCFS